MILKTKFKDLLVFKNKSFKDKRGYFKELIKENQIKKKLPFTVMSYSKKNVIRGLHIQTKKSQGKFISILKGKVYDVALDLRKNSKTFGKVFSIILSKENALGLFIPAGFAHAYYSYTKENIIYYKLDNYYNPKFESGIIYSDTNLKYNMPTKKMIVSKKDKNLLTLDQFKKKYKYL